MFAFKIRKHVRLLSLFTALVLALMQLVGCGGAAPGKTGGNGGALKPGGGSAELTAADSYTAFTQAKGEVFHAITDAISSNPDTALESISFIGVAFLDLALIPAACFGLGAEMANTTLGFLGAENIDYSEDGNIYSVKYKGEDGAQYELQGEYDKGADALKCIAKTDGKDTLVAEYRKTSYGYVAQYYSIDEDGTFVYQITVSGQNGVLGISQSASMPASLTGDEAFDFPKQSQMWYEIKDNVITALTSAGEEITFIYPPSDDE